MKKRIDIRSQKGQTMAEFVMIAPIFLLLVFGIIQFGVLFNNYVALTDAVRVGARQAAVSRTLPSPSSVATSRVIAAADHLDTDQLDVTVTPYDPNTGSADWVQGGDVTVKATYPYSISLLGLVVKSGRFTSQTTERVE